MRSRASLLQKFAAALSLWSLSRQLALLVLVTALPLFLSSLLMFYRMAASEREGIRQSLMVSTKTLVGLVDNEIATHSAIAATLAHSDALQRDDLPAFWLEAKQALEFVPGSWLAVSDAQAHIVLNTLMAPGTALPDHVDPDLVQRGFITHQPQVSGLVSGPVTKRWTTVVEAPVYRGNLPLYSLSIAMPPARFQGLIADLFTRGEVVGIVDKNHVFVARIPDHEQRVGTLASEGWRAAMAGAPEGWTENKTVEGNWSLTAYAPTRYGWTVGIARLETDISRPFDRILWGAALAGGALTLLSAALASLIARNASGGISALARAAMDLGEGQKVAPLVAPFAEARTIADALANASAELNRRNEMLARANSELEVTVEQRTKALVAEMKRREATEVTLRQVQKIDSIGQLTGGLAHDFNNMLTIILGNLDTIQRRLKNSDNAAIIARPLESALQGARSAARLTHRLLAFARQQPLAPSRLDLNALVASLADMLTRTVGESVKLQTVSGAGLWLTLADANQMENTLVNLAVNARDAMSGDGTITIETGNAYLDETYAAHFGDVKAGQYVMLSVSDTGTGIAPAVLLRVFDPFFTTKEPGKGTGLGLAMIHGFVKQSGGHIRIYSEEGVGTSVKIYLPRLYDARAVEAAPREDVREPPPIPLAVAGEIILLVEDDEGVREFAVGALEDLGYQVVVATNGDEALTAFAKASRIDALFTDVVLGGAMTGKEIAERIRALRPSLPVLFTTGYTRNAIVSHGRLDEGVSLLNKPFTQRDLALKIRAVIDAGIKARTEEARG